MSEDKDACVGIVRDGASAIVDLRQYSFPDRCLVTREAVGQERFTLKFKFVRLEPTGEHEKQSYGGALKGSWSIWALQILNIHLAAPLISKLHKPPARLGEWLLPIGLIAMIAGAILAFIGHVVWDWPVWVAYIFAGMGLAVAGTGVWFLRRRYAPLSIRRFSDGFIWLKGVHPELLAQLPSWHESAEIRTAFRKNARSKALAGLVLLAIGVGVAIFTFQTSMDVLASPNWAGIYGAIDSARVTEVRSRGRGEPANYEASVVYSFQVDGRPYSGTRVNFGGPPTSTFRQSLERDYAQGKRVYVYYDPRDPSRSCLSKGSMSTALFWFGSMALPFVCGVALLVTAGRTAWKLREARG